MLFNSYFLGGFECTTGFNREGDWIDLVDETWHLRRADGDYRRLCEVGIRAVRDSIRWPLVDKGGGFFDFSSVDPLVRVARKYQVEVVWDLFHFGYPADLDLLSRAFAPRFAAHCAACARYLHDRLQGTRWRTQRVGRLTGRGGRARADRKFPHPQKARARIHERGAVVAPG